MNLERDSAENDWQDLEFILTPSLDNSFNLQAFLDPIIDELCGLGHRIEASLPDFSYLPPANFQAPIINWEQIQYICRSVSFRTQAGLEANKLPINLSQDSFVAIGAFLGACKVQEKKQVAFLYLDSRLNLSNFNKQANDSFMGILSLQKPEHESFLAGINYTAIETPLLQKPQIFQLGLCQASFARPDFCYYSSDMIEIYGLSQVLQELEENLKKFEHVYIHWNMSCIQEYGLSSKQALQIANWIDFKLRRKNRLLGLNLIGLQNEFMARQLLLRILGATYFNSGL